MIVALMFLVFFFLWLAMKQGYANDKRLAEGKPPAEADDAREKVLVWPDLVYIELMAMVAVLAILLVWAMALPAPPQWAPIPPMATACTT